MPSYYQKPKLTVCQRISNYIKWFSSLFGTNIHTYIHTYIGQEFYNSRDYTRHLSNRSINFVAAKYTTILYVMYGITISNDTLYLEFLVIGYK